MSYLIIGGTVNQQEKKINEITSQANSNPANNPDWLEIKPDKTIGIDQIRQVKNFLGKKSWHSQNTKTVIIYNGEAMTPPAQNAFLKTLEEPPPNSQIVITSTSKNALLPTIISRCQTIQLTTTISQDKTEIKKYLEKWEKITSATLDERLSLISKTTSQDLDKYIQALQFKFNDKPTNKSQIGDWLENLVKTKQLIESNVSLIHAVDWLVLSL
jgi:DNA polymerase-3 subunit delta'